MNITSNNQTPLLQKTKIYTSLGFTPTSKIKAYKITSLDDITALEKRNLQKCPSQGKKIPLAIEISSSYSSESKGVKINTAHSILKRLTELKTSDSSLEILSIDAKKLKCVKHINLNTENVQHQLQHLCDLSPELQHLTLPALPKIPNFNFPQNVSSLQIKLHDKQKWVLPAKVQNVDIKKLLKGTCVDFSKVEALKNAFVSEHHEKIEGKIIFPFYSHNRAFDAYLELIMKSGILSMPKYALDFTISLILNIILMNNRYTTGYFILDILNVLLIPYLAFLTRYFLNCHH